jgi:hypothetical protein
MSCSRKLLPDLADLLNLVRWQGRPLKDKAIFLQDKNVGKGYVVDKYIKFCLYEGVSIRREGFLVAHPR